VQPVARLGEASAFHKVVPFRDQIAKWAALVTERDAAAHATGSLLGELLAAEREIDLPPVPDTGLDRAPPRSGAFITKEPPGSAMRGRHYLVVDRSARLTARLVASSTRR